MKSEEKEKNNKSGIIRKLYLTLWITFLFMGGMFIHDFQGVYADNSADTKVSFEESTNLNNKNENEKQEEIKKETGIDANNINEIEQAQSFLKDSVFNQRINNSRSMPDFTDRWNWYIGFPWFSSDSSTASGEYSASVGLDIQRTYGNSITMNAGGNYYIEYTMLGNTYTIFKDTWKCNFDNGNVFKREIENKKLPHYSEAATGSVPINSTKNATQHIIRHEYKPSFTTISWEGNLVLSYQTGQEWFGTWDEPRSGSNNYYDKISYIRYEINTNSSNYQVTGGNKYDNSYATYGSPAFVSDIFNSTDGNGRYFHSTAYTYGGAVTSQVTKIPNAYGITYDSQGGTAVAASSKVYTKTNVTSVTPTREHYKFLGWYTQPNGGGTKYNANQEVTLTSDLKLYAHWQQTEALVTYKDVVDNTNGKLLYSTTKYKLLTATVSGTELGTNSTDNYYHNQYYYVSSTSSSVAPNGSTVVYRIFKLRLVDKEFTKTWNDRNNELGYRPNTIYIDLYRNGSFLKTYTLTSSMKTDNNTWKYTMKDLIKYNTDGSLYNYTIVERMISSSIDKMYNQKDYSYNVPNNKINLVNTSYWHIHTEDGYTDDFIHKVTIKKKIKGNYLDIGKPENTESSFNITLKKLKTNYSVDSSTGKIIETYNNSVFDSNQFHLEGTVSNKQELVFSDVPCGKYLLIETSLNNDKISFNDIIKESASNDNNIFISQESDGNYYLTIKDFTRNNENIILVSNGTINIEQLISDNKILKNLFLKTIIKFFEVIK